MVLSLLALTLIGCKKATHEPDTPKPVLSGLLKFGISQGNDWSGTPGEDQTKATAVKSTNGSYRSESFLMECDDPDSPLGEVYIYMVEEDYKSVESVTEPQTRSEGEPDTKSTPEYKYGVFAYQGEGEVPATYTPGDGVTPFTEISNLGLDKDGKYDGDDIYAPGAGTWLHFFAYGPYLAPESTNPKFADTGKYPTLTYEVAPEPSSHVDLLFGGTPAPISGEVTAAVELNLSHILSKVIVKAGTIADGVIKSISLTNLQYKGTFNGSNSPEWDLDEPTQTYTQEFTGSTVDFKDLYLMPQTLSDAAEIKIVVEFTLGDGTTKREYTLTKKLKAFLEAWASGKQYTYVISTPHEVEVTVEDEVVMEGSFPVKKNLTITNTGLADAYLRVAISGAWVVDEKDSSGNDVQIIVSDWKDTDGEFTWSASQPVTGTTNTNNWRLGPDGFYYYMDMLSPGEAAKSLFDTYKLTASAPMPGAYLELSILAQAVYHSDRSLLFHPAVEAVFLSNP